MDTESGAEEIVVDLRAKKTEAGWIVASDKFWLAFTPKLFEWIGWVFILGALDYMSMAAPTIHLTLMKAVCVFSLQWYFMAFFWKFNVKGLPFGNSPRSSLIWRGCIAFVLSFGFWFAAQGVAGQIAAFQVAHP